jgi:DNA polymerase elongation subunit (family B)
MQQLKRQRLEDVLVFDIETVPGNHQFDELSPAMQELWGKKHVFIKKTEDQTPAEGYFDHAGIYAEFGKIVCISAGIFYRDEGKLKFRVKSFASENEKEVLEGFKGLLDKHFNRLETHILSGHNIKEFDIPYTCRRMLINGVDLPKIMDLAGKKPWEVLHIDTLHLWGYVA